MACRADAGVSGEFQRWQQGTGGKDSVWTAD